MNEEQDQMKGTLHITSGDCAGKLLVDSDIAGEVFVWHDVLYDGPRKPGWPDEATLNARARFLEEVTGGGLDHTEVLHTLKRQYAQLAGAVDHERIVLWFDACLFDQSMLVHILACLPPKAAAKTDLLCIDSYPGIERFNGLGQLQPYQLASLYNRRRQVSDAQLQLAYEVDRALAVKDLEALTLLAGCDDLALPWIPAAISRWLAELPNPQTGLGKLEFLALQAIRDGRETPAEIYEAVAAADTPPQFWGDITLWAKVNALADHQPPYIRISGPTPRLPQWTGKVKLEQFRIQSVSGTE